MSERSVIAEVSAANRIGNMLAAGFGNCAMEGRPLTERQQADMIATALLVFDGLGREIDDLNAVDYLIGKGGSGWPSAS
ncbi:MAG: hypothetical protein IT175_06270 [Acidobacteria bacterium]|nr:hypothetical protein [Acidobacteriota bacterium]